jgi:uncharacterized protein YndB with AHSA1/START domain
MADIIHRIGIKSSPEKVYEALSTLQGLSGWWTEDVEGEEKTGGRIRFRFRTKTGDIIGEMLMEVKKLDPKKEVKWRCVEGPADWIGTDINFEWSRQDGQVIIIFGHRNWAETTESMAHCSMKWAVFLLSLRDLVETGKGKPSPGDLKIDNWN